ncbi:MAG: hypothetical protein NT127_08725 [Sphingobacteriales bacterium]|nr:hypothetical protein [Sphingobacteriales bacterium]
MPITKTDYKILREKIIDWNKKNPDGFMRWDVLANFIYGKNKKPKDEENIKRQIRRVLIYVSKKYEKKKINNQYVYKIFISERLKKEVEEINKQKPQGVKKIYSETLKLKIEEINKYISKQKKEEKVFQIENYIGKDGSMKNYHLVYPLKIIENNKNKKLSFFWAIIMDPREFKENTNTNAEADREIKRFYFSRIEYNNIKASKKNSITTERVNSFILSIEKFFLKENHTQDFELDDVDDFGFLVQPELNYDLKTFIFNSDTYFKSILEINHKSLYDSIYSQEKIILNKNIKNNFIWNIRIQYVDIQRIAKLLMPYLNHIVIKNAKNKNALIAYAKEQLKLLENQSI